MSDKDLEKLEEQKLRENLDKAGGPQVLQLTSTNFDEVINGETPVVVDFFTVWCPPCKMMEPIFDKSAEKYAGGIKFARLDLDKNQDIAMKYQIFSVPTFIIFKKGATISKRIGAMREREWKEFLDEALK